MPDAMISGFAWLDCREPGGGNIGPQWIEGRLKICRPSHHSGVRRRNARLCLRHAGEPQSDVKVAAADHDEQVVIWIHLFVGLYSARGGIAGK